MTISLIVAIAENNVIGRNNSLIWHLPADLKFFKSKTTGHHIVMGRKTFESISGGKPLPNRTSIIVTRQTNYTAENCLIAHSLQEAIDLANNEDELFIIGGREIYEQAMNIVDYMYITHIHKTFEGDTFFPKINFAQWQLIWEEKHVADEKNKFDFTFTKYRRNQ